METIIRSMTIEDYSAVKRLWQSIRGFGIRSIDDSEEGVRRFLTRNPGISVTAVQGGEIVGAILCGHDGRRGCLYHVCVREDSRRQGIGKAMVDFCMEAVKKELENETYKFYTGTSYRHCLIWDRGQVAELTPPHDVLGQTIGQYLPMDGVLREMQKRSYEILANHPINRERKAQGKNPANSIWFWGPGTKPILTSFEEKNHKKGVMISAVDLLKGIAVGAGMANIEVEGANGGLDTNYEGKAQAAVDALVKQGYDFAYIHVEAPDEMGHQGSIERKIKAIENLDSRVIRPVKEGLDASGEDYRLLILPDHPTPIRARTHTSDPVPYILYDSRKIQKNTWKYNEREAKASGNYVAEGHKMMDILFS